MPIAQARVAGIINHLIFFMEQQSNTGMTYKTKIIIMALLLGAVILVGAVLNMGGSRELQTPPTIPSLSLEPVSEEEEAQESGTLALSLGPEAVFQMGSEGRVDVVFDTEGRHITVIEVSLTYDPREIEVVSIDSTRSPFDLEVLSAQDALAEKGKVHIVRGKIGQAGEEKGYNGKGVLASLIVKPKKQGIVMLGIDSKASAFVPVNVAKKNYFRDINGITIEVR